MLSDCLGNHRQLSRHTTANKQKEISKRTNSINEKQIAIFDYQLKFLEILRYFLANFD